MTLHTSRRRVSYGTRLRYRTIRNFIRKAIGTPTQAETRVHSNIEFSVPDLKDKIIGIESQQGKVSKHCRDSETPENTHTIGSSRSIGHDKMSNANGNLKSSDTTILYEASNNKINIKRADVIENILTVPTSIDEKGGRSNSTNSKRRHERTKSNNTQTEHTNITNRKTSKLLAGITCSPDNDDNEIANYKSKNYSDKKKHQQLQKLDKNDEPTTRKNRSKKKNIHQYSEFDQEFISDIIQRQYKPVKLFGKRESDFSQFSAPVCRDNEYSIANKIYGDNDLCSCCFEQCKKNDHKKKNFHNLNDMKSVCDTRLYSSKKRNRYIVNRHPMNDYNNSAYYDIVPVKEKSSPQPRQKKDVTLHNYKEVPPSPRTQRPRLNLKARPYDEYNEGISYSKYDPTCSRNAIHIDSSSSDTCNNIPKNNNKAAKKRQNLANIQDGLKITRNLKCDKTVHNMNEYCNQSTPLITQANDSSADNTEKTLGEIKDMLQSFLSVITKESLHNNNKNNCDESNSPEFQDTNKYYSNTLPNGQFMNNYNVGSPFVPLLPNPCCYPVMPVYPINYLQNGNLFPSASQTYNVCTKTSKEIRKSYSTCNHKQETDHTNQETRELIKEIYKFVSQSPKLALKKEKLSKYETRQRIDRSDKELTSRSAGSSLVEHKRDSNLGRPVMKCVSRSCEAIGSIKNSYTYETNACYSDTVVDRLSVEATPSSTPSETNVRTSPRQVKGNKIQKILTNWKLWGRKKQDVIEELSESDTTREMEVRPKAPQFRQNIMNYAMHGQEFYNPPPLHSRYPISPRNSLNRHGYSRFENSPKIPPHDNYPGAEPYPYPPHCPPAPPYHGYDPSFYQTPQIPLCLKEIEVKSTATQSDRKISLFRKLTRKSKVQQYVQPETKPPPANTKVGSYNWKNLQNDIKKHQTPPDFTSKTREQLEQGDKKMRNAMLKKLFYKRNPFSPGNLIMRTLLGKDESSYARPPQLFKPKMFM